jgi:nucleoside-diphosphate-sugar epimerase
MRFFLTGATGFVGGAVARQLLEAGHQVRAVVRDPERARDLRARGAELLPGDVGDKESLRPGMQGTDGVFHIAGWYKVGTRDQSDGVRVNILGTRNVLELMRELGIRKGVYTSSLAVNSDTHGRLVDESYHFGGPHLSEYDRTKAAAHELAQGFMRAGLPLVIVMPGLIYGPGDTSSLRVNLLDFLRGRLPMMPTRTRLCWAHVDDVARAHVLAMDRGRPGETYIIAGEPYTLTEAFALAAELTGRRAPAQVPYQILGALSRIMGLFERFVRVPETYSAEGLRVIAGVTYLGDNSRARRELGYDPRPLRIGLKETLDHELRLLESP